MAAGTISPEAFHNVLFDWLRSRSSRKRSTRAQGCGGLDFAAALSSLLVQRRSDDE
jgi:hypothetical protein